jgi:hypothetical protein
MNWDMHDRQNVNPDAVAQFLAFNAEFAASQTSRERCYRACKLLREDTNPPLSYGMIGRVLGLNPGTVIKNYAKFQLHGSEMRHAGRPSILSQDEYEEVIGKILHCHEERCPVTVFQVCQMIRERWGKEMIPDTFYHIAKKDPRIRSCAAVAMENVRLAVTQEDIDQHFHYLRDSIEGVPAHFVFNMDEMGHQPWADALAMTCFVPSTWTAKTVQYPVSRQGKRITLIACIGADGSVLRPAVVIPRKTYDDNVQQYGLTSEKLDVYHQQKGYIDRDIFDTWFKDTFLAEVRCRRKRYAYRGPAYLIMDNCTAHSGTPIEAMCQEGGIIPLFIPPHSSHLLQMLDLSLFGVTKRAISRLNKCRKRYVQMEHIADIVEGFLKSSSLGNVVASFKMGGISLVLDDNKKLLIKVTPETAVLARPPEAQEILEE